MNDKPIFLEIVQLHERSWGAETYPSRPSLANLMGAVIVVMWVAPQAANFTGRPRQDAGLSRFTLECFDTPEALYEVLFNTLFLGRPTVHVGHRISKVYLNGSELEITGLRLLGEKK
jgi:hypothetical protein